jgi:hypothetical protein
MKNLILKSIDLGADNPETYQPDNPYNFSVSLTILVGPSNQEGGHLFQVCFCTLTWLAHQLSINKSITLRHMILIETFDFDIIQEKINEIIQNSERETWDESINVLSRYFFWEFEDYQV